MVKMANVNKISDFNLEHHRCQERPHQDRVQESLVNVVKCFPLALRFANCCFCWMTVTMVYYGLSLNATNLAGSPYTNFVLVALVEIPGILSNTFEYFSIQFNAFKYK